MKTVNGVSDCFLGELWNNSAPTQGCIQDSLMNALAKFEGLFILDLLWTC